LRRLVESTSAVASPCNSLPKLGKLRNCEHIVFLAHTNHPDRIAAMISCSQERRVLSM